MSPQPAIGSKSRNTAKHILLKQLHTWHWMSSAVCLIGLLLFAVTGITLNHAADIESAPVVTQGSAVLPPPLLLQLDGDVEAGSKRALPKDVGDWLQDRLGKPASGIAEWSETEIYLALPRPGGDGWIAIDRKTGAVTSESTSRGWVSYLNDLHKGRNTGNAWKWFIDLFAIACVVFAVTGFFLLQLHAARRPYTWPLVGAGLAAPAIIAIIFTH